MSLRSYGLFVFTPPVCVASRYCNTIQRLFLALDVKRKLGLALQILLGYLGTPSAFSGSQTLSCSATHADNRVRLRHPRYTGDFLTFPSPSILLPPLFRRKRETCGALLNSNGTVVNRPSFGLLSMFGSDGIVLREAEEPPPPPLGFVWTWECCSRLMQKPRAQMPSPPCKRLRFESTQSWQTRPCRLLRGASVAGFHWGVEQDGGVRESNMRCMRMVSQDSRFRTHSCLYQTIPCLSCCFPFVLTVSASGDGITASGDAILLCSCSSANSSKTSHSHL